MKKALSHIIFLCCILSLFPAVVFAAENDTGFPITVKADTTTFYYEIQDQISVEKILIEETAENSFEENQEFIFSVKKRRNDTSDCHMLFEQNEKEEITDGSLKVEYSVEDGKLIVVIKESDPSKQESFTISNLLLKPAEETYVIRMYPLLCETSGSDAGLVTVVNDFIDIVQERPPVRIPVDIVIKVNYNFMLLNGKECNLTNGIYTSNAGYTMFSIRDVSKAIPNSKLGWEDKTAYFVHGVIAAAFPAEANEMYVNGVKNTLCNKAEIRDGRMYVSFRDICRIYNIPDEDICWDNNTKTITINTEINDVTEVYSR